MPSLSVRQLAQITCRQGDLYPVREGGAVDAATGIAIAAKVQQARQQQLPDYAAELVLSWQAIVAEESWTLRGRADGVYLDQQQQPKCWVIEEFKCVRGVPVQHNSVDLGQALIYAGLHAYNQMQSNVEQTAEATPDCEPYLVRLVYVDPDTLTETTFEHSLSANQAIAQLDWLLLLCIAQTQRRLTRGKLRDSATATLAFPYPAFRASQKAIARKVFQIIRDRQQLLLEAPTGSGKTLAVTYPAVRAMQQREQLFFATSRTTGALAGLDALGRIDPSQTLLSVVQITAKDTICPIQDMPCRADQCPRAAGYFDRLGPALEQALQLRWMDQAAVSELATEHQLCPFELSLDLTPWSDVIVGDYNYLFDPQVRLQRLRGNQDLHLLLDEAHQIAPRVNSMLSVSLQRDQLRMAIKQAPEPLKAPLRAVDRQLLALAKTLPDTADSTAHAQQEQLISEASLQPLGRSVQRCLSKLAQSQLELSTWPHVMQSFFELHRWQLSEEWLADLPWQGLIQVNTAKGSAKLIDLAKRCLDPALYIRRILDEHGASVRFSGTVSPLDLYQRLHGCAESAHSERAASGFKPDQLGLFIVDDVPTYYRSRERHIDRLAQLVEQVSCATPGRYLVALPSFAYLRLLASHLQSSLPVITQEPQMDAAARESFMTALKQTEHGIALIVMGGVFGESVDFSDSQLRGVLLVGLGLPPPSVTRRAIEQHFDEQQGSGWGKLVAFTQPALVKVVQAAGRLLRSDQDRGIVCLIDERFKSTQVQQFFPAHWQPQIARSTQLPAHLHNYWASVVSDASPGTDG